jgi:ABC-type transporter Mla maintaining outer membrane lipid asymmetry ATPase subunit MlaF
VLQAWQTWAGGATTLSLTGVLPKAGPGRAVSLALRSRLFFKPETVSVRDEDAAKLRQLLVQVDSNKQAYIEVVGPKGIGKSVLIDTVLKHKAGLVEVEVHPGTAADTLIDKVNRAIGGHLSCVWSV